MMENYRRTDLACEIPKDTAAKGVRTRRGRQYGFDTEETVIEQGEGETASGRAAGRYTTLHCGQIWLLDKKETARAAAAVSAILSDFVTETTGTAVGRDCAVLVAGLGNRFITPDSIGPRTADLITVTSHAAGAEYLPAILGCASVSAIAPGVLGQTGIEAASLVADAARAAKADVILAVDALAAR